MSVGDYGLFVTLSDYTANAKKYLDKNPIIKGINGYDKLDEKYQKYIPLKMVYIPIMNSDDDTSVSVSG